MRVVTVAKRTLRAGERWMGSRLLHLGVIDNHMQRERVSATNALSEDWSTQPFQDAVMHSATSPCSSR